jgi:hypothetical protein
MDEVVNILLFATPNSWQVKMEEQNWDPMDHTPTEVVDFMECLESAKAMDLQKHHHDQWQGQEEVCQEEEWQQQQQQQWWF